MCKKECFQEELKCTERMLNVLEVNGWVIEIELCSSFQINHCSCVWSNVARVVVVYTAKGDCCCGLCLKRKREIENESNVATFVTFTQRSCLVIYALICQLCRARDTGGFCQLGVVEEEEERERQSEREREVSLCRCLWLCLDRSHHSTHTQQQRREKETRRLLYKLAALGRRNGNPRTHERPLAIDGKQPTISCGAG